MAGPINHRQLPGSLHQMLERRYFSKGRNRNPKTDLQARITSMLVEKRLPEKVLTALQDTRVTQRQREKMIQSVVLNSHPISHVFNVGELSAKRKQVVFGALYSNILRVLEARGRIRINPRTGKPILLNAQRPTQLAPSYIGVCDVAGGRVAKALLHEFRKHQTRPGRKFMLGAMTHPVVLDPSLPVPPAVRGEISRTFQKREDIARSFIGDKDVLNTIHYADLYGPKGPWPPQGARNIPKYLEMCVEYGGRNLNAIQLDVNWPKPEDLKEFRKRHPNISLVLQVGKFSLKAVNSEPQKVVNQLREYGKSIDYVLLDMSMGQGKAMASGTLLPLLRLIKSELPNLGLAVAGGLGPEHSKEFERIAREFPDVSLDAQGRLKPDSTPKDSRGHYFATDSASVVKSREYFRGKLAVLDRN